MCHRGVVSVVLRVVGSYGRGYGAIRILVFRVLVFRVVGVGCHGNDLLWSWAGRARRFGLVVSAGSRLGLHKLSESEQQIY